MRSMKQIPKQIHSTVHIRNFYVSFNLFPITTLLTAFTNHFKEVFGQTASSLSVHDELFNRQQGKSSMTDYALQFHTLTAVSGWNEMALKPTYCQGLSPTIR